MTVVNKVGTEVFSFLFLFICLDLSALIIRISASSNMSLIVSYVWLLSSSFITTSSSIKVLLTGREIFIFSFKVLETLSNHAGTSFLSDAAVFKNSWTTTR